MEKRRAAIYGVRFQERLHSLNLKELLSDETVVYFDDKSIGPGATASIVKPLEPTSSTARLTVREFNAPCPLSDAAYTGTGS
jgi:hypothetical protein